MPRFVQLIARLLVSAKAHEHLFMVVVAILIGCLGGFGAVGFRWLISAIQRLGWGSWEYSLEVVSSHSAWWIILVPAAGGALVGPLVHFLAREAKGHGVPEVMEAVALRSGYMRARLVVIKSLASAISIASGGSVGREGPIVQIGSAIGSVSGQVLRVSGIRLRTFVGCGAAAGIAATFNAPIAGALFAVEIILGDFAVSKFSPIVISSVTATVVSRHFLGDSPAFAIPQVLMASPWELLFYLALGVVAALVAVAFIRVLYGMEDLANKVPVRPWLLTPIGGAVIGVIGLAYPQIFGVGYEAIEHALRGEMVLGLLVTLLCVKLLATSLTIAVGFSGGIFAPSLFLGSMTGGAVGSIAHHFFPSITAVSSAYALVGMGAVVAAATQAPITAILIIFELTSSYQLILPLMASCIIATLVAQSLKPETIYTMKLIRRGVDIRRGREVNVLRSLRVRDAMTERAARVPPAETFGRLLSRIADEPAAYYYVVTDGGQLRGVIGLSDVSASIPDAGLLTNLLLAEDIARDDVPTVNMDDDLDTVMRIFDGLDREELPVVDEGSGRLLGVISRRHLVEGYNRELMKRDMVSGIGTSVQAAAKSGQAMRLGDGFAMVEMDAPGEFIGLTIRELDVRRRYGVEILLIRKAPGTQALRAREVVPVADEAIGRGDRLVVVGQDEALVRLQKL
ncbi:MAG: chloride channel protein [Planctomycetes bacterium]|nr:chloride channel protein [Planctomycetota bacterium]